MKTLFRLALILVVLSSGFKPLSADQVSNQAEQCAIEAVNGYLGALVIGDIQQLRGFLATEFIKERQALLSNPDYRRVLEVTYANASFNIIGSQQVDDGIALVDAEIVLTNQDIIHSRFQLSRSAQNPRYRIIAEN